MYSVAMATSIGTVLELEMAFVMSPKIVSLGFKVPTTVFRTLGRIDKGRRKWLESYICKGDFESKMRREARRRITRTDRCVASCLLSATT